MARLPFAVISVGALVAVVLAWVGAASIAEQWEGNRDGSAFKISLAFLAVPATLLSAWLQWVSAIKRSHDCDRSGWTTMWSLVPFCGVFLFLYLLLWPGSAGENRFGPAPWTDPNAPGTWPKLDVMADAAVAIKQQNSEPRPMESAAEALAGGHATSAQELATQRRDKEVGAWIVGAILVLGVWGWLGGSAPKLPVDKSQTVAGPDNGGNPITPAGRSSSDDLAAWAIGTNQPALPPLQPEHQQTATPATAAGSNGGTPNPGNATADVHELDPAVFPGFPNQALVYREQPWYLCLQEPEVVKAMDPNCNNPYETPVACKLKPSLEASELKVEAGAYGPAYTLLLTGSGRDGVRYRKGLYCATSKERQVLKTRWVQF